MHDDENGRIFPFFGLPMAMPKEKRILIHLKTSRLRVRNVEAPRHERRGDGHGVTVSQQRMRLKLRNLSLHIERSFPSEDSRLSPS